jgi:hypothetical protein
MAIDFKMKDVIHQIIVKFYPSYLPGAKKKYNAKAVLQPELDIHGVASKASVYNITTPAKVIEEGFTAALELIIYLIADNYKIKTDLFHISIKVPGEYDGSETHLPPGIHPEIRMSVDRDARKYVIENVKLVFDGIEENSGFIGEVTDDATGLVDEVMTRGNIITVRGYGLKVEGDDEHAGQVGAFLGVDGMDPVPFKAIAQNEPRTLKLLVPDNLEMGMSYTIYIYTMSAVKGSGHQIKNVREVKSSFSLAVI